MGAAAAGDVPEGTETAAAALCDLCEEMASGGRHALTLSGGDDDGRLIVRNEGGVALAGLGAIVPGYVVVMPESHVLSVGQLGERQRSEIIDLATYIRFLVSRTYGGRTVVAEHGSGAADVPGRACVDHAHVHVLPVPLLGSLKSFVPAGAERICDYSSSAHAHRRTNYHYCRLPDGSQYMSSVRGPLPSQFARQRWAELHERATEWDWGIVLGYENIAQTVRDLRRMDLALRPAWLEVMQEVDEALRETIDAYNSGARRFAAATGDFPEQSTLPVELKAFAHRTEGVILDAGAGACRDSYWLATRGRSVLAVDASGPLLAAGVDHPNMAKIEADVRVLPLPDASVGGVWCSAVLLHLSPAHAARVVTEFRRVLARGGLVQLSTKEDPGLSMAVMAGSGGRRRVQYVHSLEAMCRLLTGQGFSIERTWDETQCHDNGSTTRWLKVLARAG